jgi:hypothetical protein
MQADWLWGISESWSACVAIRHYQRLFISPPARPVKSEVRCGEGAGGAEGTRTPDPLLAKEVLSQLSYGPTFRVNRVSE